MAYGSVTDVRARAGALGAAFVDGQPVGEAELQSFLASTAAELDVGIAAHGYPVPVTDPTASAALASVNADMALLLAIDAAWPGSSARDDVADLRTAIAGRVSSYMTSLKDGEVAVLLYLGAVAASQGGEDAVGGASSFWTQDALTYDWWSRYVSRWGLWADPWGGSTANQPEFTKGMSL